MTFRMELEWLRKHNPELKPSVACSPSLSPELSASRQLGVYRFTCCPICSRVSGGNPRIPGRPCVHGASWGERSCTFSEEVWALRHYPWEGMWRPVVSPLLWPPSESPHRWRVAPLHGDASPGVWAAAGGSSCCFGDLSCL